MKLRKVLIFSAALMMLFSLVGIFPAVAAGGGTTRLIPSGGTTSPVTGAFTQSGSGDVTQVEFPGQMDSASGPGAYPGVIVNRSLSRGGGAGSSVKSGQKAKSNPQFQTGFEGLNFYDQRYARGGNQFSVEPPDQALCAGNGYVVEAVNDVINVYDTSGNSLLPANPVGGAVDLNSFYGYAPAINRHTGVRGQFVTDPSCLYDAATQRFFVVVLTLETNPSNGAFTLANHIDVAVSKTSNPTGLWNIYRTDVTNDGSNPSGSNACPCLGDYPHIGADANGFYVTTNAYPWGGNGFDGAQIYAFSKAQLAAGAASVTMVHLDTFGMVNAPSDAGATQPGFTVWPAQTPGSQFKGNTEFFLSSNAADEATHPVAGFGGNYTSSQLVVWTLKNTGSLNSASPSLSLSNQVIDVNQYGIPPKASQPGSGSPTNTSAPLGNCINDTSTSTVFGMGCWNLLFSSEPPHSEVISRPDSNDTRMQQVTYANGKLWGSLDTALNPDNGPQRAGIAYFVINPDSNKVVVQGYLGATGYDFTYPAIGVTESGRGVMTFTATGDSTNPSAAYAAVDGLAGVSTWNIVSGGTGNAPDDGFTSYKVEVGNPPRTRWGDYGAAAVDGNSVWIASEYIASNCNYTTWGGLFFTGGSGTPFKCGNTRGALGNWSTRISQMTP